MVKRTISLILAILLIAAVCTGCGGTQSAGTADSAAPSTSETGESLETSEANAEADTDVSEEVSAAEPSESVNTYPLCTDGSIEFEIMLPLTEYALSNMTDYLDGTNIAWPALVEATGVTLDMKCVAASAYADQANLVIASQSLPDVMIVQNYAGGPDQAYEDGLFTDLAEYEDLMPNYMKFVNYNDTNRRAAYTEEGHLMSMSQVMDRLEPCSAGVSVRRDWLDELNLEMPTTLDEFHNVLLKFHEYNGGNPVMDWSNDGFFLCNTFNGVFDIVGGLNGYFVCRDGDVVYTPTDDGYRKYVELVRDWYKEGLIKKEFANNDLGSQFAPDFGLMATNTIGAAHMQAMMSGDFFASNGVLPTDAYFEMMPYPTMEDGSEAPIQPLGENDATVFPYGWMISSESEEIEHVIQFLDFVYGDEGIMLSNYGIEGETYTMVDGKPVQSELFTNNPDGLSLLGAQEVYLIHNNFVMSVDRVMAGMSDEGRRCEELWNGKGKDNMPTLNFTADESVTMAGIQNDLNTYVSEQTVRWMTNAAELDDAAWEDYCKHLEDMRCGDLEDIYQAAYDRWMSK